MRIIFAISCVLISVISLAHPLVPFESQASFFIDSNSKFNIQDLNLNEFIPFPAGENINIGYNQNAAVWCNFKLKNTANSRKEFWLCFNNIHLDSLQLFSEGPAMVLGDRTKKLSPFIITQAFMIELHPYEEKEVMVRLKKGISFMDFSYNIRFEEQLQKESKKNLFLLSFFLGIIFLLILFNGILFIVTREKLYLLYIAHSFISACYVMIATGYAKHILFPDFLLFSEFRIYSASLWFIVLSIFLVHFLDLKQYQKLKYQLVNILNGLNLMIIITTIMMVYFEKFSHLKIFSTIGYLNFAGVIFLIIWAAISHLKLHKANAVYVLLAFMPHLIWSMSIILKAFQITSYDLHTDWLIIISFYEVLLFGYVLTRNYFSTFQDNSILQKQIIREKELSLSAVTNAQIRERMQIANLIHDKFGSKLTHVLHLMELQKHELVDKNVRELTKEIRDLSHQIMPKALNEGALASSLKTQIRHLNEGTKNCKIHLNTFDFPECIEQQLAHNMYLISLELISNALKHGKPTEMSLEFYSYPESFVFQYSDNGKGFDIKSTPKGFGLNTIENRILGMNGSFEVNSVSTEGTNIQIEIPR